MTITQAVIPAAGLGTRFLPLTKVVPKELLPLGSKPAIAWIVEECLEAGIRDICFIISKGKELIPAYFRSDLTFEEEVKKRGKGELLRDFEGYRGVSFHVVYQEEQLGDGHALLHAKDWLHSDPCAVLFPDDVIVAKHGCLQQMMNVYEGGAMVALLDVPRGEVGRYGIVATRDTKTRLKPIADLVEKPNPQKAPSTLAIMGRFLLPLTILRTLEEGHSSRGGERRIVDAFRANIGHLPVAGYLFEGTRYDLGTPEGYWEAMMGWGNRRR